MLAQMKQVDARVRVVFLALAAVGVFLLRDVWALGVAIVALSLLWLVLGLPARRLVRQFLKLWGFALFIALSYGLFENDPDSDRWVVVLEGAPRLNVGGLLVGLVMFLRVLAVVLASQVARAGDPRGIAAGLGKLAVPQSVALPIDAVLALLGDGERHGTGGGRGRGGGTGGGGGMGRGGDGRDEQGRGDAEGQDAREESLFAALRRVLGGDVGPIAERLELQIDRAERHIHRGSNVERAARREIAVIAGVSLTMLGVKALKLLPSIPFAPGHKLVILTPLYIVARLKTRGRLGATLTGLTMGSVAFLMGDGKYGVFEILKHIAPGVVCDVGMPILMIGRRRGALAWSLFGGVIALARFATIFAVTLLVQAPSVAYAMLLPGLTVHMTFGILSGYVTHHLVRVIAEEPGAAAGANAGRHEAEYIEGAGPDTVGAPEDGPRIRG